ncbi:hypothetical protein ANO11243_076080 [Dothideomycetidae sp. 11243]|nr:hypothetical protein ANO11243_076080 [fungal sp. No.11243]
MAKGSYTKHHESPDGPGDARPTAAQIIKDLDLVDKLSDKTILVTGGTDGLGKDTVRQLAKTGAHVFFTARNPAKADKVLQEFADEGKTDLDLKHARIEWIEMDNNSLKSVKAGAEDFLKRSDRLNVLLCNAAIGNVPYHKSEDGFEGTFAINHLAHVALFQYLKDILLKSSSPSFQSRVVVVASAAHGFSSVHFGNLDQKQPIKPMIPLLAIDGPYNPIISYGQSKTANIWFANEIDRRYGSKGLRAVSLHPGAIRTPGFHKQDPRVLAIFDVMMASDAAQKSFKSIQQGAATQVWAAVSKDLEGKGGVYLEDCGQAEAAVQGASGGYQPWAFDEAGQKRLWAESLEMVGMKEDE